MSCQAGSIHFQTDSYDKNNVTMQSVAPGVGILGTGLPDNLWDSFPNSWFICSMTTTKLRDKSQLYRLEIILKKKKDCAESWSFPFLAIMEWP